MKIYSNDFIDCYSKYSSGGKVGIVQLVCWLNILQKRVEFEKANTSTNQSVLFFLSNERIRPGLAHRSVFHQLLQSLH